MKLIEEMLSTMDKRKVKSLKSLSVLLGIPYQRMTKWTKGLASPKTEDAEKIKEWIESGKTSTIPLFKKGVSDMRDSRLAVIESRTLVNQMVIAELMSEVFGGERNENLETLNTRSNELLMQLRQ